MTSAGPHLTDVELDELMMGVGAPELQAHCDGCALCGGRSISFAASMDAFNGASLAWSEARSNTVTRDLSGHRPTWRLTANAARSVAATLVFGVVAAVTAGTYGLTTHGSGSAWEAAARPALRGFAPEMRAQEIDQDNAMLEAIDSELTEPRSVPATLFQAGQGPNEDGAAREVRD